MDYEIQRCTRHCHASGRELAASEPYYSVLVAEGADLHRYDYAIEAWQGPPAGALGWWRSQRSDPGTRSARWAPNDVLLDFFDRLEGHLDNQDMRYVLALLLVRRRVMRQEESQRDEQGREVLILYCPRRDATYRVTAETPDESRIEQIQQELARLLQ